MSVIPLYSGISQVSFNGDKISEFLKTMNFEQLHIDTKYFKKLTRTIDVSLKFMLH